MERAVPDYESMRGLRMVAFSREDEDDETHFLPIKIWGSIEIMKHFTDGNSRKVKCYSKDAKYLPEKKNTRNIQNILYAIKILCNV